MKPFLALAASLLAISTAAPAWAEHHDGADTLRERLPQDEVVYFVLPDRFENGDPSNDLGGLPADRLKSGFDPAHKGFYHGGDLKGLIARLDYIQGMGVTAIWFAPIFKNKPVQGPKGDESSGYHGYWVTDFTQVDPHFGTNDDFRTFVDAAHARGIKVYMDIITNHTADVIRYAEDQYQYRSKADYPYSTRGGPDGAPINSGFAGDKDPSAENWAKLTDPSFAYTPVVPASEKDVKVPAWLNDPIYYHNRGDSFWIGESSVYGDFVGLDDLATEHPRVVSGMIEIFGDWIDRYGIDGFRIDTAKHVNPEFWQAFVPAMLERAEAKGIPNFHIFGEIAYQSPDAIINARVMAESGLPYALDMGFAAAAQQVASGKQSPRVMAEFLEQDAIYPGGAKTATGLPTFLGNHDFGRFSMFVKQNAPDADADELLARVMLGHAMMFTLRGVPTVYYGDEQGFVSDGNDQLAREDMFPSKVAVYNDNTLLGTDATTAESNFDTSHPLYRQIAELSKARTGSAALRRGLTTIRNFDHEGPGLLAVERHDADSGERVLLAYNTSGKAITRNVEIDYRATSVSTLLGDCPAAPAAPGTITLTLPPYGYAACALHTTEND
ncbi:alpha-amylase family glycosyl hydrolase [Parerythrobacter lacustris]|uniref:Alpha-amylase family glycosyl hydrolase n=1 Tax=Parerythrobacter lacustris TaxID=2969984 RepID=A0ABT1XPC3_9SPHN|nr:alpha-amylase family glycosyl hydrolase [Parerythrobacter lacustris]MCR2833077.1 alpha-amylase family glycosyl hydrolase [Parerythrobacter lacustris]